jgi:YHS domain-containing protein
MMHFKQLKKQFLWVSIALMTLGGCSQNMLESKFMHEGQVALDGYDMLAYRSYRRAIKADATYRYEYEGLVWHFDAPEHKERFANAPEFFLPAFGGYCANAMAEGEVVNSNPEYWYLLDDQLYLFEDLDAKEEWFFDLNTKIMLANAAWKQLTDVNASALEE